MEKSALLDKPDPGPQIDPAAPRFRLEMTQRFGRPSPAGTVGYIAGASLLYVVPGSIAYVLYQSALPWLLKLPAISILIFVSAHGLFALAGAAHEGFHFTLHRDKRISAVIGVVVSSAVPLFFGAGFFVSHWDHHRFTNQESDPDLRLYGRFRTLISRALLARLAANRNYQINALRLARGRLLEGFSTLPLNQGEMCSIARLNIATQALWIAFYAWFIFFNPAMAIFCIGLPFAALIVITGLNPYQEHAATGVGRDAIARTRPSVIHSILMLGTNFHLEHHLYPSIPCWRLSRVHKLLKAKGFFGSPDARLAAFVSSYRYVLGGVPYGPRAADRDAPAV